MKRDSDKYVLYKDNLNSLTSVIMLISSLYSWGLDNLRASEPCEADVRGTQVSLKNTPVSLNSTQVSLSSSLVSLNYG